MELDWIKFNVHLNLFHDETVKVKNQINNQQQQPNNNNNQSFTQYERKLKFFGFNDDEEKNIKRKPFSS